MDLFNKTENNGAKFSDCGKHRLALWRIWDENKPLVMFIGLNPSTADAISDDPTIRRVKAMAKNWGYGGVYMMNLFTFISTDPKKLNIADGNLSSSNNWLFNVGNRKCSKVICAWGNFNVLGRDKEVLNMFKYRYALHINKNGSPKHPLYVRGDVQPIIYQ